MLQVAALHHKTSVQLGSLSPLPCSVPALSLFHNLLIFLLVFLHLQLHSFLVTHSCLALIFTFITSFCYLGLLTSLPSGSYLCQTMRHRGDGKVPVRVCVCTTALLIELLITRALQLKVPHAIAAQSLRTKSPPTSDETLVSGWNF